MLCNDSYNNPSQTKTINEMVGTPYSIRERFKMGGIGSPKMEIVSSSATIY
jgi:carbamoylphosphate synthase large subunit